MIGSQDLLIALVIGVFLFGAKKLPELASSLGRSMKEFKKATMGNDEPAPPIPPPLLSGGRSCASCQAPLDAPWTHCPRCGTPVTPPSAAPRP